MRIEFSKMQGLGNDFIVFDAPVAGDRHRLSAAALRALANRRTGIGFDQALMLNHRAIRTTAPSTGYSTRTAARSSSVGMAPDASRPCCM